MKSPLKNSLGKEEKPPLSVPRANEEKVIIEKERCKGCALCVLYCPRGRIRMSDSLNNYGSFYAIFSDVDAGDGAESKSACNSCGFCYIVCPEVAIEVRKK